MERKPLTSAGVRGFQASTQEMTPRLVFYASESVPDEGNPPPPHCRPTEQGKKLRLRDGERLA